MFFELFIVLRSLSALWALGFASLCKAQLSNPLRVLSKTQPQRLKLWGVGYWVWAIDYRLLAIGDGLLAMGDGLLGIGYGLWVMGDWLLAIGYRLWAGVCGVPLSVPFASNLSPHHLNL